MWWCFAATLTARWILIFLRAQASRAHCRTSYQRPARRPPPNPATTTTTVTDNTALYFLAVLMALIL
ncbi:uncharacterized protein BDR25DRAFT_307555 [Lindgomyces ingoldianus]|uniref:Uncharacterized protein n=1 Tax=Lindgomyces ingoldianus TaxID=673940 RepID=A0ACB6QB88_9PLEO|nr:uncharacterized protein BDR25DRAFT_307555 [Lindgomyces ingoldianus]KAF2463765.1 hypothetical protein BDR25DRAFT_307555 [Lindgomyces ingoldianus]